MAPRHSDGIPDRHSGKRESEAEEEEDRRIRARSKPILKKIGSPPGRARRARSKLDPDHRRVDFRPEVVVFRFNRERGEHVGCESQSLNGEPEARNGSAGGGGGTPGLRRQSIGARTTNPLGSPVTTLPGSIATNRNNNNNNNAVVVDGWKDPNAAAAAEAAAAAAAQVASSQGRHPPSLLAPKNCEGGGDARPLPVLKDSVRFQYFVDDSRNSILQFSLPLGAGTSANDVVVKANRHGDRIRVFGCGGGASGGAPAAAAAGVKCRELCERFALPVRVDSYEISARIDANGVLFVEAPILPNESLKPCLHPVRKAV